VIYPCHDIFLAGVSTETMYVMLIFFRQQTPLHLSSIADFGGLEICQQLLASKADIEARNMCCSPLHARRHSLTSCTSASWKLR
jgi:hypothetical protein